MTGGGGKKPEASDAATSGEGAKRKTCFVVGPIGAEDSEDRIHADWLLDGIIKPVFAQHFPDYDVVRSDKIATAGMIDAQMINHLLDDELVIADLSLRNANAFYEIGIRHMIEKPIVHVVHKDTSIPFDVAPYRAIPFSNRRHSDITRAQVELVAAVQAITRSDYVVDNPVTRARGTIKLKESATPEIQIIADRLDAIEQKITSKRADAPKNSINILEITTKPNTDKYSLSKEIEAIFKNFFHDHLFYYRNRSVSQYISFRISEEGITAAIKAPVVISDEFIGQIMGLREVVSLIKTGSDGSGVTVFTN